MLKSFKEMRELDLSAHTQKKPTFFKNKEGKMVKTDESKWLDYIEWAVVLDLLYEHGAEFVSFTSSPHPSFPNTLVIKVQIDDSTELSINYPIINGNAVLTDPNALDIHKAELRGFVKCVAIHTGLGLNLWMKEEESTIVTITTDDYTEKVDLKVVIKNANSTEELNEIWSKMNENDQTKHRQLFADRKNQVKNQVKH